jgi:hypothetical protein
VGRVSGLVNVALPLPILAPTTNARCVRLFALLSPAPDAAMAR